MAEAEGESLESWLTTTETLPGRPSPDLGSRVIHWVPRAFPLPGSCRYSDPCSPVASEGAGVSVMMCSSS
ncbi:GGA3 isoform 10 [Pan troglodytes]|uniref:Golgi associated, gamma adaptin ear containing, ARF binding protein 3 n=2 Tax=Homininae TaxID=207598 RepID=G3V1K5_HUMAN|nr:golgi associated, gamma adaptin ear containing, ARF binding protein 3 [Homo sapiens]PNI32387.1 GGA3 isoform 8 [Pan troglodytes]KAI2584997.1 golgi associated, gamma adaptin ear containing, ARF binding protein 3 [Homo sapiens]KAI4051505.1 golgi associated, gamma adaptin ear containing, ARF binding protein 3 [Homo sapiens]KAI4051512.1 golgi associated, gamma adaptin ear containing, ARF binding protein 3 [Homo sapiens]